MVNVISVWLRSSLLLLRAREPFEGGPPQEHSNPSCSSKLAREISSTALPAATSTLGDPPFVSFSTIAAKVCIPAAQGLKAHLRMKRRFNVVLTRM